MAEDPERTDRGMVTVLVIVWFVLTVSAVLWALPRIEDDLTAKTEQALGDAPIDVRFDGRDATLISSEADGTLEEARATVSAISGVRKVTIDQVAATPDTVTVRPPSDPPRVEPTLADPSLLLRARRGSFTLTGSVADTETVEALTAAAVAALGELQVTIDVSVDADTLSPRWLNDPFPVFAAVGEHGLGFEVFDNVFRVTGAVPDEGVRSGVVESLTQHVMPTLEVVDRLVVVPIEEPIFSMDSNGGSVTLRGALPSQEEIDAARAAAEKIYGATSVATWFTVDVNAPPLDYFADPEVFFRAFEGRTLDFFDTGQALIVSGTVPSEEIRTSIGERILTIVDPRGLNNDLIVVTPDETTQSAIDGINRIIGSSLNFAPNSTSLGSADQEKLDEVAGIMNENPNLRAVVEGHTDNAGSTIGNQRLSEERARSVADYLISVGVDANRLTSIGFGEERPVASNNTSSGRAQNRRIEFKVEGGS